MAKWVTRIGAVAIPILAFIVTLMIEPILKGAWINLLGYDIVILGYVLIGFSIFSTALYFLVNEKKHPNQKFFLYIVTMFLLIMSVYLLFPNWFSMVWFS